MQVTKQAHGYMIEVSEAFGSLPTRYCYSTLPELLNGVHALFEPCTSAPVNNLGLPIGDSATTYPQNPIGNNLPRSCGPF